MTSLKIADQNDVLKGSLKYRLGLVILCLLLSVWVHLIFFSAWQWLDDSNKASRFIFELEPSSQMSASVLELTLDVPPDEFIDESSQLVATDKDLNNAQADGRQPEAAAAAAADNPEAPLDGLSAESGGPAAVQAAAVDKELARAELPAPVEDGDQAPPAGSPGNPDPSFRMEKEAPQYKAYETALRRTIYPKWIMPPEARNNFKPARLITEFTIARDGTLKQIVVIESSGSAILDHAGLEALRAAAPYPPFPEELSGHSQRTFKMIFNYEVKSKYVPGNRR